MYILESNPWLLLIIQFFDSFSYGMSNYNEALTGDDTFSSNYHVKSTDEKVSQATHQNEADQCSPKKTTDSGKALETTTKR